MKLIVLIIMNIVIFNSFAKDKIKENKKSNISKLNYKNKTKLTKKVYEPLPVSKTSSELIREYYLKRYDVPNVHTKRMVKIALIDSGFEREETIPQVRSLSSFPATYPHGTHVGGVILGVNPNIELYSYNVYVNNKKSITDNVANAIEDAIERKVEIINLSLEGEDPDSSEFDAIEEALDAGIIVVIAAGNKKYELKNDNSCKTFPACYKRKLKDLIIVGNVDNNKTLHRSSNYGELVDVFYYGSMIPSYDSKHGINTMSGTSISAPFITGLISLLIGNNYQKYSPHDIVDYIKVNSVRYNENPNVNISLLKMKITEQNLVSGTN